MELESKLKEYFGYSSFRIGQKQIIQDVLQGKDVLAMLPTGTGKSICYQLPALLLNGITVIVSPLLSLMEDQVQQLKSIGIKSTVALNSFLSFIERKYILQELSKYKIVYVSPEILQSEQVINAFKKINISLFVIDEAHCISQWGHEFRTDYLKLADVRKQLGFSPCLALTATATVEVQKEIINLLNMENPVKRIYSVDRENIAIMVKQVKTIEEKLKLVLELAKKLKGPGMIYVSTRKWAEKIAYELSSNKINHVAYYHGGLEKDDRLLIQQQFINKQLNIICCTNAFGMGINKKDVRFVIHFHYPLQIESYLQEIGRAGRDGEQSIAMILHCKEDRVLPDYFLEQELPTDAQVTAVIEELISLEKRGEILSKETEEELIMKCGLSENLWRFFRYHFELKQIIIGNLITLQGKDGKLHFYLRKVIELRQAVKQKKLSQMENWLEQEDCRRRTYMQLFDEELLNHPFFCCDNCGLDETIFYKEEINELSEKLSWKRQLKMLLHQ